MKQQVRFIFLAGEVGIEPTHVGIKIRCLTTWRLPNKLGLAGDVGFEPTHVGIKIRCLNQLGESPILVFSSQEEKTRIMRI